MNGSTWSPSLATSPHSPLLLPPHRGVTLLRSELEEDEADDDDDDAAVAVVVVEVEVIVTEATPR